MVLTRRKSRQLLTNNGLPSAKIDEQRHDTNSSSSELADHFESLSVSPASSPKKSIRRSTRISSKNSSGNPSPIKYSTSNLSRKRPNDGSKAKDPTNDDFFNSALPGREQEYQIIMDYITDSLATNQGKCIYISGVPGTGKTATVKQCINTIQSSSWRRKIGKFNFIEINGMKLSDVSQAYSILWKGIRGKNLSGGIALKRLTEYFGKESPNPIIVLLDELDLLLRKRSSMLYHFFEWTGWATAKLIVIAIANTMDLPERFLPNRIASRMGTNRINFKPYTYPQLMAIINHRQIEWKDLFHPDALEYCARKVSAVSGDARRALNLAKRAIDWVRSNSSILSQNQLITIPIIEQAIQMTFAGNSVQIMGDLSMQQKFLLISTLLVSRALGSSSVGFERVCENHWQLLRSNNLPPIPFTTIQTCFHELESMRLISRVDEGLSGALIEASSIVKLNVTEDEISLGLRQETILNCPGTQSGDAGKASACQGCPNQQICVSTPKGPDLDIPLISENLSNVRNRILVLSGKGGVGKSTVTCQLARALAQNPDCQVGVLDVDICGPSVPKMLGLEGEEMFSSQLGWSPVLTGEAGNMSVVSVGFLLKSENDAVIWRGPKKNALIKQFLRDVQWENLDFLLVDTPPGTSDEHLALVQLISPITGAILVTTPQEVSWQDVRKEIDFCRKTNINILGIVINMAGFVCPSCKTPSNIFKKSKVVEYAQNHGIPILATLPMDPRVGMASDYGESLAFDCPIRDQYLGLARDLLNKLDNPSPNLKT